MNRILLLLTLTVLLPGVSAVAAEPGVEIPTSWLQKAKGYEKALEIQKQTGADIFLLFTRTVPSSERGLCEWFRTKGLENNKVKKYLRGYIRVEVPLPSNPDSQKLAETFEVRKTPGVFIVRQKSFPYYCGVFDWSSGRPELYEPEKLIELFRARSSDRYQVPESQDQ